jgi:N-formylglutamate amidohydrolase
MVFFTSLPTIDQRLEHVLNKSEIFRYYPPKNRYIGILSIPHSGEEIPEEFYQYLTTSMKDLNCDVDYKVDHLVDIESLNNAGIAVIVSNIHRTCVDLNRSPDISVLTWKNNSKGKKLVLKEPSTEQNNLMVLKYHTPYFEMIRTMISELHKKTDKKISLIDLHSMPSVATEYHLKVTPNQPKLRPDFCVSDIEGKSSEIEFLNAACEKLEAVSTSVNKNFPYYGGFITRHIHAEFDRINNIQIEISRAIYMDENTKELITDKSTKLKKHLTQALIRLYEESI